MNVSQTKKYILAELKAAGVDEAEARRETEIILQDLTGLALSEQILKSEQDLSPAVLDKIEALISQRRRRVPLQYCLGRASFMGREFLVEPGVFIPRPDTEALVEQAAEFLKSAKQIAEVGTGSGAIVVSLLKLFPDLHAFGIDVSARAIEVTRANAERHNVLDRLELLHGDWRSLLPDNLDAVVSNPPYIPRSEQDSLSPEIILHEPETALFGDDPDGLGFYRQLSLLAAEHMKPAGRLIVEVGDKQAQDVGRILTEQGWLDLGMRKDMQGIYRVVSATRPLTESQKELNC